MRTLVINALSALRGGGQTYIINFLEQLGNTDVKVVLIVSDKNKKLFDEYRSDKVDIYHSAFASKNILFRTYWERFKLPGLLTELKATVYYAPGGVMITKVPNDVVSVTALRNMLPFDINEISRFPYFSYIRFKLWLLRYVFLLSYNISDKVVFISNYSMEVVKNYINDIGSKSLVIPHGINDLFISNDNHAFDLSRFNIKKDKFYLYVSILDVYKAQKEIIEAWSVLHENGFKYPLVLVGPKYNNYGDEVVDLINDLGMDGKVIYIGPVDYKNLPGLYKSSRALLFASSCECCPNILLEKLASGKPTFCSNISPMPEFGGDAVVYFDPYNPQSVVEKVLSIDSDEEYMKDLAIKARKQAMKFNWETTVTRTIRFMFDK